MENIKNPILGGVGVGFAMLFSILFIEFYSKMTAEMTHLFISSLEETKCVIFE